MRKGVGAFDRTDMQENILAAVVRLNEAETFLAVKPLHGSCRHGIPLSLSTSPPIAARQRSRLRREIGQR